jgi:hypothetical protein
MSVYQRLTCEFLAAGGEEGFALPFVRNKLFPRHAMHALLLALWAGAALAVHKKYAKHTSPRFSDTCDTAIPGQWTGFEGPDSHPLGDLYALSWSVPAAPGAWTATMIQGGGWGVGHAQLSPDNTTVTIAFDSGVNLTGNVSNKCSQIDWDNDSRWAVAPPPPAPITDVHIIAMNQ